MARRTVETAIVVARVVVLTQVSSVLRGTSANAGTGTVDAASSTVLAGHAIASRGTAIGSTVAERASASWETVAVDAAGTAVLAVASTSVGLTDDVIVATGGPCWRVSEITRTRAAGRGVNTLTVTWASA